MLTLISTTSLSIIYFLLGGAVGALIAFFVTKKIFEKQLKENPPINEKMIRAMYMQMGRKPSEAQIRQIMKSMGQ
ncbi:YneF family protein [Erysipelothrix rhusiopathiae]|nr:YneF family protein [Erysipelothrix rhusiopathiae]MDE8204392.1 YneF family protein [Erysipelothrix rhusiopathiae]MDE8258936.1 YneF family protein [Erysipelothrix rhusiopathiae]MDE8271343.1 YneF family protein [Erysipelothrix rhusiopathiae]MDE8300323.1 YneF family protein [Erysipelothrix rhusiopathiae]